MGCYWECEHRAPSAPATPEVAPPAGAGFGLFPVEDTQGRALQRCRDCGDFFHSAPEHARDHEQLRQLGMIPDDPLPQPWGEPPWDDPAAWRGSGRRARRPRR